MSVAHIRKLQENTAALCKMAAKLSGRFPDVIHPGGKWRQPDGIPYSLYSGFLSVALPWIPNNSPQSQIALVIKKLSKHQNITQFD
ncbi:hypothetical protein AAG906_019424 [Vitis piasezkii]